VLGEVTRHWAAWWPGADVAAMAADARARVGDAVDAWGLSGAVPLQGGNVALVLAARRRGRSVVLKVHPRGHPDDAQLAAEGAALAFWAPTGAVPELLDRRDGGFTLLMERLCPGQALDASGVGWDERLAVLGRLAGWLHEAGPPPEAVPPLAAHAASWRRALAGAPALLAELDALLAPADTDVLVHGDLHGGNALRHGDGWRVIDPHAARGDRHADVWALLDPLVPELPADRRAAAATARAWVARYADAARLDPARAGAWARLRARAEALDIEAQADLDDDDRAWARRLQRMADALGREG
jgi:streptomycin 6-kinase